MLKQIKETTEFLKNKGFDAPDVGVVLGTGLGGKFVAAIDVIKEIDYTDIPNFPIATVEFHSGKLIYGKIGEKKVVAMQGRFHYYEGYSMQEITFPIRVLKMLGIKNLLISNASGNMNTSWQKGELMLIDDHINLLPDNPLRGPNLDEMGGRFPDMSQPYNGDLNNKLEAIAKDHDITLRKGVYVSVIGPNLETRAEYRFLRNIGADAVGMSTVPEVIVANHMSLPCCAISVLTDDCDPDNLAPANIEEIIKIAGEAEVDLTKIYIELINQL
ncbi:purine-nucleoside phosphorylase [Fulvivirga sp. RKSG066]|uniref:purine-nucleoside phosphorylase n=1 Tax=Fulvivirga aurantia TaxID=2529383 RepID=UPI0012BB9892|nr:purine-nucleoside phosphorylase [Fulvivirga aurantia]MTI23253.1 purine-nucleoside phosphorylase [Fulvivirga aurantia]